MAKMEWDGTWRMTTTRRQAATAALWVLWEIIRHPRTEFIDMEMGYQIRTEPSSQGKPDAVR